MGYDANLPMNGMDYYYQFKLSDYLWHGNAAYIKHRTIELLYTGVEITFNIKGCDNTLTPTPIRTTWHRN